MTWKLVVLAVLTGIATSSSAGAQGRPGEAANMAAHFLDPVNGITVEQAVALALAQEPGLRVARAEVEAARGMRLQASVKPNPTVSFMQQVEPGGTDAQTRVDAQWPLDLFRKKGRVSVADREIETAQYAANDRERLLAVDVRAKFGEVLAAVRELSVTEELSSTTGQLHGFVAARSDEGAVPRLDRDMIRIESQRLLADTRIQAGHAEHAVIELKALLGLAPEAPLTLREDLEQLVQRETAVPLAGAADAAGARPDVNEARARVRLADARFDQAVRESRVDMSLFGMYMRMDAGFPQRGFGAAGTLEPVRGVFNYVAGGVMVSLPFRDRKQGERATAVAQRQGAEAQLEAVELAARAEVASARARDEQARQAVTLYTTEIRTLAKQNLDVVGQAYELGRLTLTDVLNERRRYLETERAYTYALSEAYAARQALRRALGEVR